MTRSLPAAAGLPVRTDSFCENSARPAAHAASTEAGKLSLTVTIEEQPERATRRFAFRAARQAERRAFSRRSTDEGAVFAIADQRSDPDAILDHHAPHVSSRFLAGAIAQARPGTVLHNPRCREAAGAYRRSNLLGSEADHRSDKKV